MPDATLVVAIAAGFAREGAPIDVKLLDRKLADADAAGLPPAAQPASSELVASAPRGNIGALASIFSTWRREVWVGWDMVWMTPEVANGTQRASDPKKVS